MSTTTKRGYGIRGALVGLLIGALAITARAEVPEVRMGDMPQSLITVVYQVIVDQGLDKKHGIRVDRQAYPTIEGLFNAVRGKQVDVGFGGWTAFAQFRAQGYPVLNVYPVGRGATLDVLVPVDSELRTLEDLKGKRIVSFAGAAGTGTVLLRVLLNDFYGFDPAGTGDLQYAGPGVIPGLLESGDVAAGLLFDPMAAKAIASGKFRSIGNLGELYKARTGDDFLWIAMITNDEFADRHADAMAGFLQAWTEALAYVRAHPEVFEAFGEQMGLDAAGVELLAKRALLDYDTSPWNRRYIDGLMGFAERARRVMGKGYLETVPEEAFSTRFVPAQ
ncbi:ABC transporter substrate-binding protein [Alloalcanivorax marinus]|uniref:ABC transporter substrate-binding protein n=1 Tax=Alloalcanivorax marinus TaxID=1177169 RepID=UPI0021D03D88|nr:ABC transporter substrate-binding protein [Alloalcanivorax marinus]